MSKLVLITGGTRGIGEACVREFAKNGYDIILNFVKSEELANSLKNELEKKYGINVYPYRADLSEDFEIKGLVKYVDENFEQLDCLVNNAGIAIDKEFEDRNPEDFRKTFDINLIAPFYLSQQLGNKMFKQGFGSIVNVSSTNGILDCFPTSIDYDASKAALINLTHNLARQFSPYVRVNAVAPGWVNTDMNKDLTDEFKKNEADAILLKRFAYPSEIANVIYFLASDNSSFINSEVVKVDGGY